MSELLNYFAKVEDRRLINDITGVLIDVRDGAPDLEHEAMQIHRMVLAHVKRASEAVRLDEEPVLCGPNGVPLDLAGVVSVRRE